MAQGWPQHWDWASLHAGASVRPLRRRVGLRSAARHSPAMAVKVMVTSCLSWLASLLSGWELPCQGPPPRVQRAHGERGGTARQGGWRAKLAGCVPVLTQLLPRGWLAALRAVDSARSCCPRDLPAGTTSTARSLRILSRGPKSISGGCSLKSASGREYPES